MTKLLLVFIALFPLLASAQSASVEWPSRDSKVICGGTVDDEDLEVKVVVENDLLKAESNSGRLLLYIDLHKPGQVHFAMVDSLNDDETAQRDAALAKLSPEDAAILRAVSASHITDFFTGFTDGIVQYASYVGKRSTSLSCQEIPNKK